MKLGNTVAFMIAFAIALSFFGCAAGNTSLEHETLPEMTLPALSESDAETDGLQVQTGIPLLESAAEYAEQLSCEDTMKLWVMEYDANYIIENGSKERLVVRNAKMEENSLGAEIVGMAADAVATTIYRLPFCDSFLFSYNETHDHCELKASWIQNGLFASVRGSGIETAELSLGGVRLTGENMEYTIKYYLDNEDQAILKVTGKGESAVCLMRTEDGFRFYCENGAVMELPDYYEEKAVKSLEIPAGQVGVIENVSSGYKAEFLTEEWPK